ncbi:MAG: hypothetical protein NTX82_01115 [Candidatus Parcubacteria bacterium]|nr:hypothetical protein [Candidatus Parcubacteria bacterium]
MSKKITLIIPTMAIAAILAAGTAQAYGGFGFGHKNIDPATAAINFEAQMTDQANLLGISVDEMKADWAAGKTLSDIAKEKGITQDQLKVKMQAQREAEQKVWLQNLVAQGKITQAQADSRLKAMQDKAALMKNKKALKGGGKFNHESF